MTTARNRAIDRLRRERTFAAKARLLDVPEAAEDTVPDDEAAIPDERLELIFTCCHPALAPEARVALTLRALGGLTTEEIARAVLVAPETMKRRLSRATVKIRDAGIPFAVPASRIFTFARDSRRFIVSGVTRNARAISSVVSPPRARRVRATRASGASAG